MAICGRNYLIAESELVKALEKIHIENSSDPEDVKEVKDLFKPYFAKLEKEKYHGHKDQILNDYHQILQQRERARNYHKKFRELNDNEPSPLDTQQEISDELLFKIVKKSVILLSKKVESDRGIVLNVPHKNKIMSLLVTRSDHRLFIIKWKGKINLIKETSYFGKGSYGIVHKVHDISFGVIAALKLARTDIDKSEKSRFEIQNEITKMINIGSHPGLIMQPRAIFDIGHSSAEKTNHIFGYLQDYYIHIDLSETDIADTLTRNEGLKLTADLFGALKKMHTPTHERGPIIHGDIKTENILVGEKSDGSLCVVLADLGSARDLASELLLECRKQDNPFGSSISPGYVTLGDFKKLSSVTTKEEWFENQMKRDIFALTTSVWKMLTDLNPYAIENRKCRAHEHSIEIEFPFPITTSFKMGSVAAVPNIYNPEEYIKNKYGEPLLTILKLALSEEPSARPSIDQILDVINSESSYETLNP